MFVHVKHLRPAEIRNFYLTAILNLSRSRIIYDFCNTDFHITPHQTSVKYIISYQFKHGIFLLYQNKGLEFEF